MNLCSDGHEEVCYEYRYCPVCELKEDLMNQIDNLEKEIDKLNKQINALENSQ